MMGRHSGALLQILVLTGSVLAQTVVPITGEPDHHLVISNDYVRVFKVEVPPKAETLYHQHDYDYLYVAIGDADVTSTRLHEKPVEVKLKDGEVELSKAPFAHKATNKSDQPFRNVTIEILGGIGTPICGLAAEKESCGVGPGSAGGVSVTVDPNLMRFDMSAALLLKSSKIVGADVLVHGKGQIDLARIAEGPYLLVPVSDVKLMGSSRNSTRDISAAAGDPVWIPDSRPALTNTRASARFILFGFSPAKMQ